MRTHKIIATVAGLVLVFSMAVSLQAEENTGSFFGRLKMGYRIVDTSGAETKYKEDINLNPGGYLNTFALHYSPDSFLKEIFDSLDVNLYNLGNEPFQTFNLSLQKFGKYKFKWDRRKSTYFYADQAEASPGHLYDMHRFNFDRVMDRGTFIVTLSKNVKVYADYSRYSKIGNSTTTQDINRIEFEVDKPIEENMRDITLGVDFHINRYTFIFEEKIQDYENVNSFFLPGYEDGGENARYPSSLLYYDHAQPYDFKTYNHIFKLNARPLDSLLIKGIARISDMDMNLDYMEEIAGTDYVNRPFEYSMEGSGEFERKMNLFDLDVNWLLSHKFAIVAAFRYNKFEQMGTLTIENEAMEQDFGYDTLGTDIGLQFNFNPQLSLTAGHRYEERELENLETVLYEEKTQRNGIFGNIVWTPARAYKFTIDYEHGTYDDPFTLISPTSSHRLRTTAKVQIDKYYLTGSYLYSGHENDLLENEWESRRHQLNLRLGFLSDEFKGYAGIAYIDFKHEGDRSIEYPPGWAGPGGTFPWNILYEGKSTLVDLSLFWDVNEEWKLGAYGNYYTNRGYWELDRQTLKAYVEYALPYGMMTEVAYRYVNYEENYFDAGGASLSSLSGKNDYQANIIEISFGYRWQ